ncbi:MAG TPA: D-2-hydroxyacid dehydrogenase family protein [Burkholderiales bacterium]|nr:D-2-hydroxyacid dehydrogenase family protein [Burkholderiales bacterium]
MHSCAILDDYQNVALSIADWGPLGGQVSTRVFNEHIEDREALVKALTEFDIIVAMRERTPFDAGLFDRLPKLKLLVTTGMRNASIDLAAAAKHKVTVCGTSGSVGSTAELAWGLILALARSIPQENALFHSGGKWQTTLGVGMNGKTLGVIGLGNLGARTAKVGLALEMKVVAWSPRLTPERCAEVGVTKAESLDDLLRASDVVSIHVVLNEKSRGMIGARELGLMKRDAILVNTSRGPLVDEQALITALREKRIGGAGIDVFGHEPLPQDHPLRKLENVVATPHLGYVTREGYRTFYTHAVEDIKGWIAGSPVRVLQAGK